MSVRSFGKVAVGVTTGTVFINGLKGKQQFANPQPGNTDIMSGIAMWGSNNLLPQEMAKAKEFFQVWWQELRWK